jgi:hypothetical protein
MGVLRSKRGPYAPRRQPVAINWNREQAAVTALRRQVIEVEERALEDLRRAREEADPLAQLVKRCHGIEQAVNGLKAIVQQQNEQIATIIENLGGQNG